MKQIHLKLRKELLLVELPEGAELVGIKTDSLILKYRKGKNDVFDAKALPFDCTLVARFPDIPESYWEGVVDSLPDVWSHKKRNYKDYTLVYEVGMPTYLLGKPKDSVISAIKADGWHVDGNPLETPDINDPKFYDEPFTGKGFYQEIYNSAWKDYRDAGSRVISLDRLWVFERKEVGNGN